LTNSVQTYCGLEIAIMQMRPSNNWIQRVALRAAGSTPGDFAVTLASDDVRDGALALALAHRTRQEARVGLGLAMVPALIGAGIISLGLLPPAYAPIASLLGGAMAVAHARRSTP